MPKPSPSHLVLAPINLPMRMPWPHTLLLWLTLDHFHARWWLWGAIGLFLALAWFCWFRDVVTRKDLFLDDLFPPHSRK